MIRRMGIRIAVIAEAVGIYYLQQSVLSLLRFECQRMHHLHHEPAVVSQETLELVTTKQPHWMLFPTIGNILDLTSFQLTGK